MAKLRAGISRIENGIEVPVGAVEFLSKSGRKCYLSGVSKEFNKYIASVRYLDDGSFASVDYDVVKQRF
jgi:hypothetical protein